jgi:glycosyltransferase involved in cell wall biosynthesis
MRFLLLNQFYPPDLAPTGWYLHGLARELVRRGHQVKVVSSRRSYDGKDSFPRREVLDGVIVTRLPATGFGRSGFVGKMTDYGSFYGLLATQLLLDSSKPDLILSLTTPPYISLLGKAAAAQRGCRHAHWIMDLYPDVIFAHHLEQEDGFVSRLLRNLTRFQLLGAEAIISLGSKMAEKVAAYTGGGVSELAVAGIPLWSDPELTPWPENEANPLRVERGWGGADVVFLYSGNMGVGHRFAEFLEAARQLGASGPRWVFSGGGKRRQEIETFAKAQPEARIEFLSYVPQSRLRAHLCAADVHLASLDPEWQGLMVPSKIQASFAVARPVLFVGGNQCETAAWIQESGGGWVVNQGDVEGLLKAIGQALHPDERQRRGQAALAFALKNFRMSENCAQIARLLEGGIPTEKQKAEVKKVSGTFLLALLAFGYALLRYVSVIELREMGRVFLTRWRRPTDSLPKALAYPLWDGLCLAGALALAMRVFEPGQARFWHSWFLDLPIWVTPTLCLLAVSRVYITVWTRARILDVLMLLFTLQAGLLLSSGIALLIDPSSISKCFVRALVIATFGHGVIIFTRIFYRCVEEIMLYLMSATNVNPGPERLALYGAGGRCQLFLKERGFYNSNTIEQRTIIGLIDDQPALHFKWVYGYMVLGGVRDLPRLIPHHRITGLVITTALRPESLLAAKELASQYGLKLWEWRFETQTLDAVPLEATTPEMA